MNDSNNNINISRNSPRSGEDLAWIFSRAAPTFSFSSSNTLEQAATKQRPHPPKVPTSSQPSIAHTPPQPAQPSKLSPRAESMTSSRTRSRKSVVSTAHLRKPDCPFCGNDPRSGRVDSLTGSPTRFSIMDGNILIISRKWLFGRGRFRMRITRVFGGVMPDAGPFCSRLRQSARGCGIWIVIGPDRRLTRPWCGL